MNDNCPKCGLPKELCICQTLAKEKEKIRVYMERRRFGKAITIVAGLTKDVDIKNVMKELKQKLACGGTVKGATVELQGDHKNRVKAVLVKMGFPADQIEVS